MRHVLKMFPKTHITIAAATSVVVAAAILMSPSADVEANRMAYSLDLDEGTVKESGTPSPRPSERPSADKMPEDKAIAAPELASNITEPQLPEALNTAAAMAEVTEPELQWQEYKIKSGDTLSSLFGKAGFNDGIMLSVIHGSGEADKLQRLYAGETIAFATDDAGDLAAIDLQRNLLETLHVEKTEEGFTGETVVREPDVIPTFLRFVTGSLPRVLSRTASN